MELKTQVHAEEGRQDIFITRDFDLPVELLFNAYTKPEIIEQWMGTKVIKLENKNHGSFQFETTASNGVKHKFNGAIHSIIENIKIIRTYEFENTPFGVQLEVIDFEKSTDDTSRLTSHQIFQSLEQRDALLKLPFRHGISIAHNKLEELLIKLKKHDKEKQNYLLGCHRINCIRHVAKRHWTNHSCKMEHSPFSGIRLSLVSFNTYWLMENFRLHCNSSSKISFSKRMGVCRFGLCNERCSLFAPRCGAFS
jgi:uncharacterized protein YndB with AHSA1/START domain